MASLYITKRDGDRFNVNQNGSVPKPTAADIANNNVLRADGSWVPQSGGGGGSSHTYSTAEQVVGTWINNKPVYEKTITFTTLSGVSVDVSVIEEVVFCSCMLKATADGWWRPLPWLWVQNNSIQGGTWAGGYGLNPSGNFEFQVGSNMGSISDGVIVIRYTKTTD